MLFKKRKQKRLLNKINNKELPGHIAIIMDGNGRWAKRRGMPRTAGHNEGGKSLLRVLRASNALGIKALTVFAFSTENWKRPKEEVDYLMSLPVEYIDRYLPTIKKDNIKIKFIGHLNELNEDVQASIRKSTKETKDNTGLIFTIALNYGSQSEIVQSVKEIANDVFKMKIDVEEIDEAYFASRLMTHDLPTLDLMIRTSGEVRISNFLLWQMAYSEFYFTKKTWPEFREIELYEAIIDYQNRQRRYGGV